MNGFIRTTLSCLVLGFGAAGCGGSSGSPTDPVTALPPTPLLPPPVSTDATLANLSVRSVQLDQVFQASIYDYTGTAPYLGLATRVTATSNDPMASIEINGLTVMSGEASDPIIFESGSNMVTILVTAEDGVTNESYSVDIDRAVAGDLDHQAYVKAPNSGSGDQFGGAVALSGDLLAVAAVQEDSAANGINGDWSDDAAAGTGAVYVFHRDITGAWFHEAYVKASNAASADGFGRSIALSGDTLAVGAFHEDSAATGIDGDQVDNSAIDSGAVYIFTRDATGNWSQQAYIKASNSNDTDAFGVSIALSGDTLVVGAYMEDSSASGVNGDETDNGSPDSGAVYVFTRDEAGSWTQQAYLKASNTDSGDQFGASVALSGDILAVGAAKESSKTTGIDGGEASNSSSDAGAVYVFARDGAGTWSQEAYIKASNTDRDDHFGATVALSGDTLVVGAPLEDSAATGINGFEADDKALNAGSAYVFVRDADGIWNQQAYIKASNTETQDQFGHSIAIAGNFLAIGANEDSGATGTNGDATNNSAQGAGAVYLFERVAPGIWGQQAYLKASNTDASDGFGAALAIDGWSLIVGAAFEDSAATGIGGDQFSNEAGDAGAVFIIE